MKKIIALSLAISLFPQAIFANNYIFDIDAPIPAERENISLITEEMPLLEHIKNIFLSSEQWYELIHSYLAPNQNPEKIIFNGYFTRDFAIFLTLQKLGINLSSTDTEKNFKNFSDIQEDSFFAPYIAFAKKYKIIDTPENNKFFPNDYMRRDDFIKILENITENKEKILDHYNKLRVTQDEENIILYSASQTSNKVYLNDIFHLVKSIHNFDNNTLYEIQGDIIAPKIDENNEVFFEIPHHIENYSLFFDHKNNPFLGISTKETQSEIIEEKMFESVNNYRKSKNILPIIKNEILTKTAEEYARYMFEANYFDHKDKNGENAWNRVFKNGYDYYIILENLGRGHTSIDSVMHDWMQSSGHNKNLINPIVTEMWFGFYGNYWVQIFGTKMP